MAVAIALGLSKLGAMVAPSVLEFLGNYAVEKFSEKLDKNNDNVLDKDEILGLIDKMVDKILCNVVYS